MTAAALLTAERGAGNEPCDREQVEAAPLGRFRGVDDDSAARRFIFAIEALHCFGQPLSRAEKTGAAPHHVADGIKIEGWAAVLPRCVGACLRQSVHAGAIGWRSADA